MTALFGRAIEIHLNRKINLENLYKWPKNQLFKHCRMDRLLLTK
jgi:hypothetical protein